MDFQTFPPAFGVFALLAMVAGVVQVAVVVVVVVMFVRMVRALEQTRDAVTRIADSVAGSGAAGRSDV